MMWVGKQNEEIREDNWYYFWLNDCEHITRKNSNINRLTLTKHWDIVLKTEDIIRTHKINGRKCNNQKQKPTYEKVKAILFWFSSLFASRATPSAQFQTRLNKETKTVCFYRFSDILFLFLLFCFTFFGSHFFRPSTYFHAINIIMSILWLHSHAECVFISYILIFKGSTCETAMYV